jgi:chromate transporter
MMEDEVVTRRRWMSREKFLDLLGATNLIPGPNSTEMAIHVGLLAGWSGLLVAGVSFILPAAIITGLLAWVYVHFGTLPAAGGLLYGVKPVVIAVVLQALWKLGRESVKTPLLACVALIAGVANIAGMHELLVLLAAGIVVGAGQTIARRSHPTAQSPSPTGPRVSVISWASAGIGGAATASQFGLWPMFLFFLKVGSVLYGSGYVLLAFLRADLVDRWGWLNEQQLLDAVAVGQVTPGPVFTTATFIGYVLGGPAGAAVATVGIFLPGFFFVGLSGQFVPRLRRSRTAGAFLDGVVVASLALMSLVTWGLGCAAIEDLTTVTLAGGSAFLLLRYRVNSAWLVLGGAVIGLLVSWSIR